MANIKSAIKRARQNIKLRQRNTSARSMYRTFVKHVIKAIEQGDQEVARAAYANAQPIIDKAASNGLIHKNKASRIKSRLTIKIKSMAA
ncbi:MAG: 30S ribosomal protein S20 [Legionella sp.]|nr:MAG: 30S ribosomal protein S20 [Legionella sp.]